MHIRRATSADTSSVADLIQSWRPDESLWMRKGWHSSSDPEWVAVTDDDQVVGWMEGHHEQPEIWKNLGEYADNPDGWRCSYIAEMFVNPEYRLQGVGRALLAAFEAEASDHGNTLIVLNPDASEPGLEEQLRRFYGKSGYYLPEPVNGFPRYLLAKKI